MIKRVLVPLDKPDAAEDTLALVDALVATGATIRFVHVAPVQDNVVAPEGATIRAEAEAFAADTILVTTGTRSSVKRALLGSVGEALLRRAGIDLLLYRPPRAA